jgi:hypothetical protein
VPDPEQPPATAEASAPDAGAPAVDGLDASARHYAAAVYGSILVTALIAVLDHEHATPSALVGGVAATVGVFWLAHVWSGLIGERVVTARRFDWRRVRHVAAEEWPMVESAAWPLSALALSLAGLYDVETGTTIALGIGIAHLFGWGFVIGRRTYGTWTASIGTGLLEGALGVGIVLLETMIH